MDHYAYYVSVENSRVERVKEIKGNTVGDAAKEAIDNMPPGFTLHKIMTWEELESQEPGWAHVFKWKKKCIQKTEN